MKLKIKHGLIALEVSLAATLVACGGGSGSDTSDNSSPDSGGHDVTSEAIGRGQGSGTGSNTVVTVTPTAGGTVVSSPAGINCSVSNLAGCSVTLPRHTHVVFTATPDAGYTFMGYGDACTGMTCQGDLHGSFVGISASFDGGGGKSQTPIVSYIDTVSGPTTGGENNLGGYLSIFGNNFGDPSGIGTNTKVYIGGVEVANYRYLGSSKVAGKLNIQQITVQVGNLTGLPMGQAEPIKVVVNGVASNTDSTYTPNPGRVLFVSLSGNDNTAQANDINHPWRHLQTPSYGGLAPVLQAGDQVVIRGGNWTDIGFDDSWFRFRYTNTEGTKPTGKAGSGWIHFTAYPGPVNGNAFEDVHYTTPANMHGGFQGANSAYYGTTGDYIAVSNLRMDVDPNAQSDAAPINLQYSGGPWRAVNNELGPWRSAIHSRAGGVSGHGDGTVVMGNLIHDIHCVGAQENHGIYADSGASNWNIGYNWVHDITGGNLIQFYDNVGLMGNNYGGYPPNWQGFTGMLIHHNWLENSSKYGLNMADSIVSGKIWNNVVKGAVLSGLRFNTISKNMDFTVAFNTFYDNDQMSQYASGQITSTWGNYNPTGTIRIYDNIVAAGAHTAKNSYFYVNSGNSDSYMSFKRNLWSDNGYGWNHFSRDAAALYGDPQFKNATGDDLTLQASSPAVNSGTQAIPMPVNDDFTRRVSRPEGDADDLGAYELVQQ